MKLHLVTRYFGVLLALSLACAAAKADPIVGAGTFNASGTVYISTTALDFGTSSVPPGNQQASVELPTTGSFSYLTTGTLIGMSNLNLAAATFTSTELNFDGTVPTFITLPADSTGTAIDLSLTEIPIDSVPVCTAADDAVGSVCTPYTGSAFDLTQEVNSVELTVNLDGDAYYAGSLPSSGTPYSGTLSSYFNDVTISELLATDPTGPLTNSYSESITTVPAVAPTPEPGTLAMLCTGLLFIGFILGKNRVGLRQSGGA